MRTHKICIGIKITNISYPFTFTSLRANQQMTKDDIFSVPRKQNLTFPGNVKTCFLGKNKKNNSVCGLKIFPKVLSINTLSGAEFSTPQV